jgi:hypothetical protein
MRRTFEMAHVFSCQGTIHILESPEILQLLRAKYLVSAISDPLNLSLKTYVLVKCCLKRQGRCVDPKSTQTIKIGHLTNIKLCSLPVTELAKQLAQ